MQVLEATYADAEHGQVRIKTPEGDLLAPWPLHTWHREIIDAWLGAGNAIQPYVAPPVPVPTEASVLQLYDEMDQTHGIDLEAAVGGRGPKALTRFRLANIIRRTDPMVTDLQRNLGWTDAQVDALFRAAAAR